MMSELLFTANRWKVNLVQLSHFACEMKKTIFLSFSFASNNTLTFGSLAQSSDTPSFGSMGQGSAGGFGALASQGGGGFGAQNSPGFGAQNAPGFGAQSPGFGSGQQQQQPSGELLCAGTTIIY